MELSEPGIEMEMRCLQLGIPTTPNCNFVDPNEIQRQDLFKKIESPEKVCNVNFQP